MRKPSRTLLSSLVIALGSFAAASAAPSTRVVEVDETTFAQEVRRSARPVLIDFTADWCGWCTKLAPVLEEIARERADVKVVKVDVDESPSLAEEYGVEGLPTLKFMRDGRVVGGMVGYAEKAAILDELRAALEGTRRMRSRGKVERPVTPYPRPKTPAAGQP